MSLKRMKQREQRETTRGLKPKTFWLVKTFRDAAQSPPLSRSGTLRSVR